MTDLLDQNMRKEFEEWIKMRRKRTKMMIEDMKKRRGVVDGRQ